MTIGILNSPKQYILDSMRMEVKGVKWKKKEGGGLKGHSWKQIKVKKGVIYKLHEPGWESLLHYWAWIMDQTKTISNPGNNEISQ